MGRDRSLVPKALASSSQLPCRSEHVRWGRPSLDAVGALDNVSSRHSTPWVDVCPCQPASSDSLWMRVSASSLLVFQAGWPPRARAKPDCTHKARPENVACQVAGISSDRNI
eukprot:8192952-Pyramimonas_sp.AAC.1